MGATRLQRVAPIFYTRMLTLSICNPAGYCGNAALTGRNANTIVNVIAFAIVFLSIGGVTYLLTKEYLLK